MDGTYHLKNQDLEILFNDNAPKIHSFDPAKIPPPIREDGSVALQ